MAATHKGTCQACGRLQKLPKGRLSNHGYTVDWGFFQGVCSGAKALPLEEDRSVLDATVAALCKRASEWEASDELPLPVVTDYRTYIGRKPKRTACKSFREWLRLADPVGRNPYFAENRDARHREIRHAWEGVVRGLVAQKVREIQAMRDHAEMLVRLADEVHGRELTPVE